MIFKAMLQEAIFPETCLAILLRHKLHEKLPHIYPHIYPYPHRDILRNILSLPPLREIEISSTPSNASRNAATNFSIVAWYNIILATCLATHNFCCYKIARQVAGKIA